MEKSFTDSAVRKRKWRKEKPELYLKNNRDSTWRRLGMDVDRANALRDSIKTCQICGDETKLHVDHSHNTRRVRGMLCRACNHGLGNFKDSWELLTKARDYLDDTNKSVYT